MAIRRQNRALFFIIIVVVIVLFLVLRKEEKVQQYFDPGTDQEATVTNPEAADNSSPGASEALAANINSSFESSEKQKAFVDVFTDMTDCLGIKSAAYSERDPVQIEEVLSQLQSDLGAPKFNSDLWMNWHLRTREGKEKRIRLEVSSASDMPMTRELRYFVVDREGILQPVDLEDSKAMNPSDETLNQMLKEGEVFLKERAGFYTFAHGERIEYVEKNGELSEIEMVRGESIFKCSDVSARENCRCIK